MAGHRVTLELDDLEEGRSRNRCYDSDEGGSGGESDLESQVSWKGLGSKIARDLRKLLIRDLVMDP